MQQLTIFDALHDIAIENGRSNFKNNILKLIDKRLKELGISEHFDLTDTKIHLRTCAGNERVFMTLLSDTGYLNDVQLYPARHDLYDYFATVRFSVADQNGMFRDGRWLHPRDTIIYCHFKSDRYYDGIYFYDKGIEKCVEGIISSDFNKELIS